MRDEHSRHPLGGRESAAETPAERELREFVESITIPDKPWGPPLNLRTGRPQTPPAPASETPAQRETREFVESITNVREVWDPALHPRGGFPQNAGWFSPSGGSGGAGAVSHGHAPLRSWPEPMDPDKSHRADRVRGTGGHEPWATTPNRVPQGDQLAFQPPPPQQPLRPGPNVQPGGVPGRPPQQPEQPTKPKTSFKNPFGQFKEQPTIRGDKPTTYTPLELKGFHDALMDHVHKEVPPEILEPLFRQRLKIVICKSLDEMPIRIEFGDFNDHVIGGLYSPGRGTIFLPRMIPDIDPDAPRGGAPNPLAPNTPKAPPRMQENTYAENNIRHEIGHAFDHMTNGSMDFGFLHAYLTELNGLDEGVKHNPNLAQFIPEKKGGTFEAAREAFAQAFAVATQPLDDKGNPIGPVPAFAADFAKYFPETVAYLRTMIAEYKKQHPVLNRQ